MTQLTDNQRQIAKTLDLASSSVIAYAAPEVPELGNLTPQGLLEEFGRLNEARKAIEKTEKTVRSRFEALVEGNELRGDNYQFKRESVERYALNQGKAKTILEEVGRLEEAMETSETTRVTVKRN